MTNVYQSDHKKQTLVFENYTEKYKVSCKFTFDPCPICKYENQGYLFTGSNVFNICQWIPVPIINAQALNIL